MQAKTVHNLDLYEHQELINQYKDLYSKHGYQFPEEPNQQLYGAFRQFSNPGIIIEQGFTANCIRSLMI